MTHKIQRVECDGGIQLDENVRFFLNNALNIRKNS